MSHRRQMSQSMLILLRGGLKKVSCKLVKMSTKFNLMNDGALEGLGDDYGA